MMREVLERRFARLEKEDPDRQSGEWPDLLLIDGGKGQLSAVCEVMEDMGVHDVPVVGVAKGPHHGREGARSSTCPAGARSRLPPNSALLFYLQRLRDEAHRFAIGTHRAKRAKSLTTSTLDEVPGIGPNRKRALLMHFGTARAVKGAALEDLEKAPGISKRDGAPALRLFPPARMRSETPAIVCALRSHGEHGAIVRLMTPGAGAVAAYVRGARGRRMRPVLMAGNVVQAQLSARTETQLPQATVELVHSRGPLLSEPLPAAAIEWATVLTATALPEGQPYPRLYRGARRACSTRSRRRPSASGWGAALVRYELLLLAELGFGLDLDRCAVTGSNDDLVAVSPQVGPRRQRRRGRALCRQAAAAAAVRSRRRARVLARDRAGPRPHRPFPDARCADRSRPRRSPKRATGSSTGCAAPVVSPRLGAVTIDALAMLFPNVAVTRGIAVRVAVSFLAEQSDPSTNRWFWSYHVRIENGSRSRGPAALAQLDDRRRARDRPRGRRRGGRRRNAADRAGRELRLCFGLPARHAERRDERQLPHGRRGRHRVRRRDPALSAAQRLRVPATARTIVLSANSDWNIANFRQGWSAGCGLPAISRW